MRSFKSAIPYEEAAPILEEHRDRLPAELKTKSPAELERAWPEWVKNHDAAIRARLERGDEDSIVNFWLYGTTFTKRPRFTEREIARLGTRERAEDLLAGRLDDLVAGITSPGLPDENERLRFARAVIERKGIDPRTAAGQDQARQFLVEARSRMVAENKRYRSTARSVIGRSDAPDRLSVLATLYRERGLSSDTSLSADFALDRALEIAASKGRLGADSVRRVAIIGPGLDFTDKAEGYDFYPLQTIQPFALIDSLIRLGLANADDLRMVTFDLSPRVNEHLRSARLRADRGDGYVMQLPLSSDAAHEWNPDLVKYWERVGDRIGESVDPIRPPSEAGAVRVRAVRVRAGVAKSIAAQDLNVVLERPTRDEPFDLIVATNILVYYDAFEQALALSNISTMLRPGGFFLTNYAVSPRAPMESSASLVTSVYFDRQQNGDTLFWYRRR